MGNVDLLPQEKEKVLQNLPQVCILKSLSRVGTGNKIWFEVGQVINKGTKKN